MYRDFRLQARSNMRGDILERKLWRRRLRRIQGSASPAPAHGNILRVPSEYATFDLAYTAASDTDVILIDPGSYVSNNYVNKSIHVIGNTADPVGSPITFTAGAGSTGMMFFDSYGAGLQNDMYFENVVFDSSIGGGNLSLAVYNYCNGYYYKFRKCTIDASAAGNYGMRAGTDPDAEAHLSDFRNCSFLKGAGDFNEIGIRTQDTIKMDASVFQGTPTFVSSAYVLPFHGENNYVETPTADYGPGYGVGDFDSILEL